jgi:hypothetical protein
VAFASAGGSGGAANLTACASGGNGSASVDFSRSDAFP